MYLYRFHVSRWSMYHVINYNNIKHIISKGEYVCSFVGISWLKFGFTTNHIRESM